MQEEEKQKQRRSILKRALITGFVGGILSSFLMVLLYYFNFTEVAPKSYLVKPWFQAAWTDEWIGHFVSIILAGVVSILPALLYFFLFRKINSIWVGIMFGIILWAVLFLLIHPVLVYSKPFFTLNGDTLVTTICLFILYGTFIGYSISYDYHDIKIKMEKQDT